MTQKTALIAGATGAAAKRLVQLLIDDPTWSVIGMSRNPPQTQPSGYRHICADLLDAQGAHDALANAADITHAFYTTRAPFQEGGVEDVASNVAMLRHLLDALEAGAPHLAHVHLVTGSKWYGIHLGPGPSPAREDAARHMPPNFYFDQQDLLAARQVGKSWTWSSSRPNVIYDFAPERTRNLVPTIGAWAAISKELGLPLDFPGNPGCYEAITDMTDASQLAGALRWMATTEAANNQAFNVTDGEGFRWRELWHAVAKYYDMEPGVARMINVAEWMSDKQPLWDAIVTKYDLKPANLDQLAAWGFIDFLFNQNYDVLSSTLKIRQAGFHATRNSIDSFITHLGAYRADRILP